VAHDNRSQDSSRQSLELAVVIPTYNERPNVQPLLASLERSLVGVNWEAIFVDDDSGDGTAAEAHAIGAYDSRVRCLRRVGRRGLASAVIEGILATAAPYVAVMDADMQHDERILPQMLDRIRSDQLDLVVASRNIQGGGMGEFGHNRIRLSGLGARLSRFVCHHTLSDPMSGFFIVHRPFFEIVVYKLSAIGFKILFDIVGSSPRPVRFAEVPYTFRTRQFGESKLDVNVGFEYLYLLLDKYAGDLIPLRFASFAAVGGVGVLLHLSIVWLLYHRIGTSFLVAQLTGTYFAMILNFMLNNTITFRDRRLRGQALILGLIIFVAACSAGALANLAVAEFLLRLSWPYYIAAAAGLVISSVWNFAVNEVFTWRKDRHLRATRSAIANSATPNEAVETWR
jgi:dolichol-phosphate mannosyltransferase